MGAAFMFFAMTAPLASQELRTPRSLATAVAELTGRHDFGAGPDVSMPIPPPASPSGQSANGRRRITSGIPMERALALLTTSPAIGEPVPSHDGMTVTVTVNDGRRFTILRNGGRLVGDIAADAGTSLVLTTDDGRSVSIPRAGIAKHERWNGVVARRRNVLVGLLVGGAGGALVGLHHGRGCVSHGFVDLHCLGEPATSAFGGLLIGGGGGAAVGALWPRHERWVEVTP
jgi:uncharacterized protein Veg